MTRKSIVSVVTIAVLGAGAVVLAALFSEPGRLVVWGADTNPLVIAGAPSGEFVSLAAGGQQQTLALRADRTLYLNPATGAAPPVPETFAGQEFCAVGIGRTHALAIRPDGSIVAWPPGAMAGAPTGPFVAVTGAGSFYSAALGTDGRIFTWGGGGALVPPPEGRFTAIAARGRFTLALAEDGNVYGWGTDASTDVGVIASWRKEGPHFIAPPAPGQPYTAIAAGLDTVLALRADGRVVQWALDPSMPAPPADVAFTQIAAGGLSIAAGIDRSGHLHAWGTPSWVDDVPPGIYSAVSASTTHISAIEVPKSYLWPPDHMMATVVLTFRADDNCVPIPVSSLSVELRSSQPDAGFGSGNSSGDTNGQDGYASPVALPPSAIVQNSDGSFTATFELRAERSNALPGSRIYTVAVVSSGANGLQPASTRMAAQIIVDHDGH